jgi:hypothetical protein
MFMDEKELKALGKKCTDDEDFDGVIEVYEKATKRGDPMFKAMTRKKGD